MLACQAVFSSRAIGVMLIALSALCFAAMPIFARVVYGAGGDPGTLLTLRFSSAAVVLVFLALGRRAALPSGRTLVGLLLMGGPRMPSVRTCSEPNSWPLTTPNRPSGDQCRSRNGSADSAAV